MKYRKLGPIDFEASVLGLGAMRLPSKKHLPLVDYDKSIEMIRYAIDQGINYIDTGWLYGLGASEKVLGEALQDGYREKVFLVTKLLVSMCRKPEDFDKFLGKQLERMQTDYLDGYLFHALSRNQFPKLEKFGFIKKMEEVIETGVVKHTGFSFHDTLPVFKTIMDSYDKWELVQIQYNYMDTAVQATHEGLRYAHEKGAATIIMEPLKGGKLANPPKNAISVMNRAENQRTPVDWALQYLWDLPEVDVVLSGMSSKQDITQNCKSADNSGVGSLSQNDKQIITQLSDIYKKSILVQCTSCQYCMPCPFGVNIPENFASLNTKAYVGKGGLIEWMMGRRYKKLTGNPKKVNKEYPNGNASICTQCGVCIPKCPQEINIPEELIKVNQIMSKKAKMQDLYPDNFN